MDDFIFAKYSAGKRKPDVGDMIMFAAHSEGSIYSSGKPAQFDIHCTVCRNNEWCELTMIETNEKLRQRTISITLPIDVADKLADWIKNGDYIKK